MIPAPFRALALLVVAVALAGSAVAQTRPAADVAVTAQQVSPRGWYIQGEAGMASAANRGHTSNAGFVVTDDGVVVIDALGTPPLGAALLKEIRRITDKPVRRVIVTHYHADHVYGLPALKAAGAEIWAHREAQRYFSSGQADERLQQRRRDLFPWVDEKTLVDFHVEPWTGLPLWIPSTEGDAGGFMSVNCDKARAAGLATRPLVETVRDTAAWLAARDNACAWRNVQSGARERLLLSAIGAR